MKNDFRICKRMSVGAVFFGALLMLSVASNAAKGAVGSKSSQWERAAINYEWAARSQAEAATAMLADAEKYSNAPYSNNKQYYKNMRKAGDTRNRAGDLYAAAGGSYDKAASNWLKVVRAGKQLQKKSGQQISSQEMADTATRSATALYMRSAEIYEISAKSYSDANEHLRQASMSLKAARMREIIAGRL